MTVASGSRVQLAYIAETVYGTTPIAPETQLLDFVSFTGGLNPEALVDPTLKSNRQRSYARRGNVSTEGQIEVVLRPDNYDPLIEAALCGTWATNVLKVGTIRRSFALEQGFTDLSTYRVFNGSVISTFSMNVPVSELVTATFGFQGANTSAFGATLDASPTAVVSKDGYFHEGGVFKEGGVDVAYLSAISFEVNNSPTTNYALGALGARDVSLGTVSITGTVTALFESVTLYNKFVSNADTSIEFVLTAGSPAESLTFRFPRVKYTTGSIPVSNDGPLTVEMAFEALFDAASGTAMSITRSA